LFFSPDGKGKPGAEKASFSWHKKATNGSSFYGFEKQLFLRGLVLYSRK
jgi:hypothetical protein